MIVDFIFVFDHISKDIMGTCSHANLSCLNPYELIRKYRCLSCNEVMMCACEESFALHFLPHQLQEATELDTQQRIPVTMGFQTRICNACRGYSEESHPKAELYGCTSKVARYYWREIWFETTRRFSEWCAANDHTYSETSVSDSDDYKRIQREVVEEIKQQHERSPKYSFCEESQQEVLTRNNVDVVKLSGIYLKQARRKVAISYEGKIYSAEGLAALHFERQGYRVLKTESVPFHALFGVFFWLLIEDPADPLLRIVGFRNRKSFERGERGDKIWTSLPEDFGTPGYAQRRVAEIDEHFDNMLCGGREELIWSFDYWAGPSEPLRQYLWAHRPNDVATAREILCLLPPEFVRRILRYLIGAYWQRYCGWPDLLAVREGEFLFVEVKSSKDKLSQAQKHWINQNSAELHLPFKVVKIHKKGILEYPAAVER